MNWVVWIVFVLLLPVIIAVAGIALLGAIWVACALSIMVLYLVTVPWCWIIFQLLRNKTTPLAQGLDRYISHMSDLLRGL